MTETPARNASPPSQAPESDADGAQVRSAPKRRTGRFTSMLALLLALLLALAALAGVGYLYFILVYLNPDSVLSQGLAAAQAERRALEQNIRQQQEQWRQALQAAEAEIQQRLQAAEVSLADRLEQAKAMEPVSGQGWRLAEVKYLLRMANHRVLMERDLATAQDLLKAADAILAALDDPALHTARAALKADILSLQQTAAVDVQGLYLRLEALKRELPSLTLARPAYGAPSPPDPAATEPTGFLATLAEELRSLVRFRRLDAAMKPLLAPDEATYLEFNLRLMLEQAQFAALQREQLAFTTSLNAAHAWVREHLDAAAPDVQAILTALAELQKVELDAPVPDISTSLAALAEARRRDQ